MRRYPKPTRCGRLCARGPTGTSGVRGRDFRLATRDARPGHAGLRFLLLRPGLLSGERPRSRVSGPVLCAGGSAADGAPVQKRTPTAARKYVRCLTV